MTELGIAASLNQDITMDSSQVLERPKEVLDQLGSTYKGFIYNLVRSATARPVPSVIVVNVGGLSESGKSIFISQAGMDFAENKEVLAYEEQFSLKFRQLTIEQGDGISLMQGNYKRAYPLLETPDRTALQPEHYVESSASMFAAVSLANALLEGPLLIWVEGTMLPGILDRNRRVIGMDKALSTAARTVEKYDAFTVLMFAEDPFRERNAKDKDLFKNLSPQKIVREMRKKGIIDERTQDELKNYFLFHTSNERSRQSSYESMMATIDTLFAEGELKGFKVRGEESFPREIIGDIKERYGQLHLERLYGQVRTDRGFLLLNRELPPKSPIHNYAKDQERVVYALAKHGKTTDLIVHRQLIEGLGIDLNNPIP